MFKREVRVLGLTYRVYSGCSFILGVVFRGRLWLDGVLYRRLESRGGILSELISMISESPHRGQIRVVVLDEMLYRILGLTGVEELYINFKLPIIAFEKGEIAVAVGVDDIDGFLRVAASDSGVEALRIASMIADRLIELLMFKS
jgi:endonuclease V-like protein UPF0215 family